MEEHVVYAREAPTHNTPWIRPLREWEEVVGLVPDGESVMQPLTTPGLPKEIRVQPMRGVARFTEVPR